MNLNLYRFEIRTFLGDPNWYLPLINHAT